MKRPLLLLALFAVCASRAQSPARPEAAKDPSALTAAPPAKNWVLPIFTDKEGFRSMTLRGAAVQPVGANRIDVTDLNITVFSGDAAARVETVLLAQSASFFPKTNLAAGEKGVRLVRDDYEVTGEGWRYDHAAKKITIQKNTRIVFNAQLKDILK